MSDTPGKNSRPQQNRRGGNRNNNNNRGPRRDRDRRNHRRDDHGGHRRDDRRKSDDRRDSRPERHPPPAPAKPSLWKKVLTILTFGLVRPGAASTASGRPPRPDAKPQHAHPPKENQRPPREPRQQTAPPAADPESVDTDRLHVGNLSYDATETDLLDVFNGIGKVQNVDIVYNGRTHRSKGFGFVQMTTVADARRAVAELHGKTFMGRPLYLGPARSRGRDEREADDVQE